jgi:hypothetical protein
MKNKEILKLYTTLSKINLPGVKFAYCVAKNMNLLKPEVISLEEAKKPTKDFLEYDAKRVDIVKKYAKKDEKGKFIIENQEYLIDDQDAFEEEFQALKKENFLKLYSIARELQMNEFYDLLEKETDIKLFKIALSDVPQGITTYQMHDIMDLVEE